MNTIIRVHRTRISQSINTAHFSGGLWGGGRDDWSWMNKIANFIQSKLKHTYHIEHTKADWATRPLAGTTRPRLPPSEPHPVWHTLSLSRGVHLTIWLRCHLFLTLPPHRLFRFLSALHPVCDRVTSWLPRLPSRSLCTAYSSLIHSKLLLL